MSSGQKLYATDVGLASLRQTKTERTTLALIILLGVLLRAVAPMLAYYATHDKTCFHSLDTLSYIEPAQSMLERGDFSRRGAVETIRTPGYPLFLLPGLILDSVEFVAIALQIIVSAFLIYFVYAAARLLSGEPKAALLAALLIACEPSSIIWTSIVQTETLFAALLMGGVLYSMRYMARSRWQDLLVCAALLTASIYVRPAAYFLPIVLAVFWAARGIVGRSMGKVLAAQLLIFLAVCYALVGLWQVRNGLVSGYWGFSAVSENNLYFFAATTVMAQVHNRPYEEQRRLMIEDRPQSLSENGREAPLSAKELRRYRSTKAIEIILRHPFAYAKVVCLSALWTMAGPGVGPWLEVFRVVPGDRVHRATEDDKFYYFRGAQWSRWGSVVLGVLLGLYWLAGAVGAIRAFHDQKWQLFLLLLVMAYFVVSPALLCIGYSRFRHPVMPILSVLAGYGLWVARQRRQTKDEG
ncbi:MAG: glycosyltransferase family 39 protein [Desulfomonilaceae bacterium]